MTVLKPSRDAGAWPWHRGELILQEQAGVGERMRELGPRIVRDHMPDQHRAFFAQLPFVVVGGVDAAGDPWASWITGEPGFVRSPDPRVLQVSALPQAGDPLDATLHAGAALAVLGIELPTRRRNRANGVVSARTRQGFTLTVQHSFGNCPQHIQRRDVELLATEANTQAQSRRETRSLDPAMRALITSADTFFVTSYVDEPAPDVERAVDVSHRGGKPGFVRVDGDVLTIPDFAGNLHFNTLGNLLINPRAGLCFVDFASGDVLQLVGRTEIVFQGVELAQFVGAQRLWRVSVERAVLRGAALPLGFRLRELSPFSLRTGAW
jgi:predicted pyridoxine 5'-phosphate oxidase superfamily flavin-nucleotide-binding protein